MTFKTSKTWKIMSTKMSDAQQEDLPTPLLTYFPLHKQVKVFSTTRSGGVSKGCYSSFNINPYSGDEPKAIQSNRAALCAELQLSADRLLLPHQVHGVETRVIEKDFFSLSPSTQHLLLEGVDALITSVPQVCIGVSTADCIPVLLYDTKHHAIAAIHAGWRGTVQRIVQHTLSMMRQVYDTSAADVYACIGPGISLKNFEVGDEVFERFAKAGFPLSSISVKKTKWHLDLPECNRLQLIEEGVKAHHILQTGICTYDQIDQYFSARRLGLASGRIYNGILLNE